MSDAPATPAPSLRELAERATPGPWNATNSEDYRYRWCVNSISTDILRVAGMDQADATYIAAANPAAILALLDAMEMQAVTIDSIHTINEENERLRSALREAQEDAARWRGLMSCERIRFLGSATAGYPEGRGHMGAEFWGTYAHDARDEQSRAEFIAFADGLAAIDAAAGSTT